MRQNQFLGILSKILIPCNFLIFMLIVILHWMGRFDETTSSVALAILIPMLISPALPILQGIDAGRIRGRRRILDRNFVLIGLAAPIFLSSFLVLVLLQQAFRPNGLAAFVHYLELGEAGLGGYVMAIYKALSNGKVPSGE